MVNYHKLLLFLVLSVAINNDSVACSGQGQKSSSLWGYMSSFASSMLKGKGSADTGPNYGKLFEYEYNLQTKFNEMTEKINKDPSILGEDVGKKNLIKFLEASAFSALFIRDIGSHLDTWMDLVESKKVREGSQVLSQHILWIRSSGSKASTSYFIYRPSFEAELAHSILPQLKYHAEAQETADAVVEVVKAYPNDQIVFVGLQSGGAVAMLHAWIVAASVPIVHRNLIQFKGELHQIKVFLFDSDCLLSRTHGSNYPIPSWDVLRFYSGLSRGISADYCKFDSMDPVGLAYTFTPSWSEMFVSHSTHVDRPQFLEYYLKPGAEDVTDPDACDNVNIDNGIYSESFDDNASLAPSDISFSVNENFHIKAPAVNPNSQPVCRIEEIVRPGIALLAESMTLTKFFFRNVKEIYVKHQTFYLRRNVNQCAAAMQDKLMSSLMGKETESPVLEKDIHSIDCQVQTYNESTKTASIICSLLGGDSGKISIFKFKTRLRNDMDRVLQEHQVQTIEDDWEEVRSVRSVSTSESFAVPHLHSQHLQKVRSASAAAAAAADFAFDDRTVMTELQGGKDVQWTECLATLFARSSHLNFINPTAGVGAGGSSGNCLSTVVTSSQKATPGESDIQIKLPYSSSLAFCEYSLESKPKNFYQLYLVNPNMFFSIFTQLIKPDDSFPPVCAKVLEPPIISHKHSGNAEAFANILNGYFNSDATAKINHKNIVVNGLEITETFTNLPSNNPYEVFKPELSGKLAECLAQNVMERIYNCNSHLTLWAGKDHCPEVCTLQLGKPLHLCSRVVDCGEGVFLGFRGGKMFGSEAPLSEQFASHAIAWRASAYVAAFNLKHVDSWTAKFKKPVSFAVFMSGGAKRHFIDTSSAVVGGAVSSKSASASVSGRNEQMMGGYTTEAPISSATSPSTGTLQRKQVTSYITPKVKQPSRGYDDFDEEFDFYSSDRNDSKDAAVAAAFESKQGDYDDEYDFDEPEGNQEEFPSLTETAINELSRSRSSNPATEPTIIVDTVAAVESGANAFDAVYAADMGKFNFDADIEHVDIKRTDDLVVDDDLEQQQQQQQQQSIVPPVPSSSTFSFGVDQSITASTFTSTTNTNTGSNTSTSTGSKKKKNKK